MEMEENKSKKKLRPIDYILGGIAIVASTGLIITSINCKNQNSEIEILNKKLTETEGALKAITRISERQGFYLGKQAMIKVKK